MNAFTLEIRTFGEFDILLDDRSVLDLLGRSSKIVNLLKYFITFNGKRITSETILATLLDNADYTDPKSVLRAQIFRLRKFIEHLQELMGSEQPPFELTYLNGYYQFDIQLPCHIDFEAFERALTTYEATVNQQIEQAGHQIRQWILLYKGEFMADGTTGDWVIPFRNKYNRLYHQELSNYLSTLQMNAHYDEILAICENAMLVQSLEESFHIFYLEALLGKGMIQRAASHYCYITQKLYCDFSIKPSPLLKEIYNRIQSSGKEKGILNLSSIESRLSDDDGYGAFFCEIESFHVIYSIEKRRLTRDSNDKVLGLVTLPVTGKDSKCSGGACEKLKMVLTEQLRKGDIFTQWNERQFTVLLHEGNFTRIDDLKKRITEAYQNPDTSAQNLSFTFHTIERFVF